MLELFASEFPPMPEYGMECCPSIARHNHAVSNWKGAEGGERYGDYNFAKWEQYLKNLE